MVIITNIYNYAMFKKIISLLCDIFFPKICFGCQKQGTYLCEDCKGCFEISQHQYCLCKKPKLLPKCCQCKNKKLDGLYFPFSYQKTFIKKLIYYFKYNPLIKELSQPLASLIIDHFSLIEKQPEFLSNKNNFIIIPIPSHIQRLKWRGFNPSEEIAKELARFLTIPLISNSLIKNKKTRPQTELSDEERKENIKNVFIVKNQEKIKNKKIILIDDVYTTGSTMEEAAKILKKAGAKEVIGVVLARG